MRRLMKFMGIVVFLPLFVQMITGSNLGYADNNFPEVEKILDTKGQMHGRAWVKILW